MIKLSSPSAVQFDGYQIVAVNIDVLGDAVTISYRKTLSGAPVDPSPAFASARMSVEDFEALPGPGVRARAAAAIVTALNLAPGSFTSS